MPDEAGTTNATLVVRSTWIALVVSPVAEVTTAVDVIARPPGATFQAPDVAPNARPS